MSLNRINLPNITVPYLIIEIGGKIDSITKMMPKANFTELHKTTIERLQDALLVLEFLENKLKLEEIAKSLIDSHNQALKK